MPKSVESESDDPQRVHYFPAAPVSLKGQLNRSRWQQECKGLSFLCTSNSHMKENNLFIRPLKSRSELTDVWEKNTTCRIEAVKRCLTTANSSAVAQTPARPRFRV